jgi:hypothetical protein
MPVLRTDYQTAEDLPALLQQDIGGTLLFGLEILGAAVIPTAGSVDLRDPSDTQVTTGAVTFSTTYAQSAISASALTGLERSMDYWATWTFTVGGMTRTFRQRVGVCKFAPDCPVRHSRLIKGRPLLMRLLSGTGETTLDVWIQRGWDELQAWLYSRGNRANLAMDPSQLFPIAEAYILRGFWEDRIALADPDGMFRMQFDLWSRRQAALESSLSLTYDSTDSGRPDSERRSGGGAVYLSSYSGFGRLP